MFKYQINYPDGCYM